MKLPLTAYKLNISDIQNGSYISQEGDSPDYLLTPFQMPCIKTNVIGVLVGVFGQRYFIEDGTGRIPVLVGAENMGVGDTVMVIGRIREFKGEKYIAGDCIKKIDPLWIQVRKREREFLESMYHQNFKKGEKEKPSISATDSILELIKGMDEGQGVSAEDVVSKMNNSNADEMIKRLLLEGHIFELSPGVLKVLE